jgi:SAM-dependent methyltransferase
MDATTMDTAATYGTWHADAAREPAMEEGHRPLWRHFIESIPETDLSTREVLDFGCNRGGFLRLLHALKPFRHAIGVDIAVDSIAAAHRLHTTVPRSERSQLTARSQQAPSDHWSSERRVPF